MGYKQTDPCLSKVSDDEPIFVLRAQDMFSPELVREWARLAHEKGCPQWKIDEAIAIAEEMEQWPTRKYPD